MEDGSSFGRWSRVYQRIPLSDVKRHYAGVSHSPYLLNYLTEVLKLCPPGGIALETGVGSGYGSVWLSLRGVSAEGIDIEPGVVERARLVNNAIGGSALYRTGDMFTLDPAGAPRPDVIHHQGVLEHFDVPQIRAILARQTAAADWVVFSVPSVFYPFEPEMGDERLLPIEEWRRVLEPFDIEDIRYYGDPRLGAREHVLCVLRGRPTDETLRGMMNVPDEPYPEGISAIVHARNEATRIAECLETLGGWTDEIIVCDMESSDETVEIASRYTDNILSHPAIPEFDRARNVSAMRAKYKWVFYLDADERVPEGLGTILREMTLNRGNTFEALLIPFRHHFAGRWMRSMYPGYTAPRLLRNGRFRFNPGLHSGVLVEGRTLAFPSDNPDLALAHYSFDSFSHYLDKLNRYTEAEAAAAFRQGRTFDWRSAVRGFVRDFASYYDGNRAATDGVHGLIYSFHSGFYRFEQHAKLYERRAGAGLLRPEETATPASVEEILEYALSVAREPAARPAPEIIVSPEAGDAAEVAWLGPIYDPSGYGDECRNFLFALGEAGVRTAAREIPWGDDRVGVSDLDRRLLGDMTNIPIRSGFIQIMQNFAVGFARHPQAGLAIGRTMFETDRLPDDWVRGCNRMDRIWVPSEFNLRTFADSGVEKGKLAIIPGCLDPAPYLERREPSRIVRELKEGGRFLFLSVFDWTLHKGWDVLLRTFLEAFEGVEDVTLLLRVWSSLGYGPEGIRTQAAELVRRTMDHDLAKDPRVVFVDERLTREDIIALYQSVDAFALPSRGEGWGRPYMEAMACGTAVIGTNWSGNASFMNTDNSYLIGCEVKQVPEEGWREIPTYKGHRWAEPSLVETRELMRRVREERGEASEKAKQAREEVIDQFSRARVGRLMREELERLRGDGSVRPEAARARASRSRKPARERAAVRWEGAQFSRHSLAHVNRELCLGLIRSGEVDLSIAPTEPPQLTADEDPRFKELENRFFASLPRPADVHVRHFFPPRLNSPEEGLFALIQPWEYGFLPRDWIEPIRRNVREVWCYGNYVRDVYLASGLPEEMLHVTPLGVDCDVFRPDAPPYVFTDEPGAARMKEGEGRFLFLFAGGTLHRKGIDILLDAYLRAFSARDNVGLVIKDTGVNTVYRGQNERDRILGLANDPTRPLIVYVDADLPSARLAGLYAACDCIVQPYRGEGFCLPPLEAMACGVPIIVPEGGPTDDFADDTVGWRVKAERRPFGDGRIGEWECVGPTWMFEVSPDDLADIMRGVVDRGEELSRKGEAGVKRARESWTWTRSAEAILRRIDVMRSLAIQPVARRVRKIEATGSGDGAKRKAIVASDDDRGFTVEDRRSVSSPASESKTSRHTSVSLCMIVKNEEKALGDCLSSVKPFVDEIIVVDTGSADRTVEIAESYGATVFHYPWSDDFSAARNESLAHATGDWIFWMDADDTLPKECGERLRDLAFLAEERILGFMMQVHIPPPPGEHGFTVVDHVKLFRNRPELRFEGRIHEQILEAIRRVGGEIERSDLYVVHSNYDHSPEGQRRKRERDLRLLELDLRDRPDHPFVWFNIGMTAFHLRDFDRAIFALTKCVSLAGPRESMVRKAYAMIAGSRLEKGDPVSAREWAEKGLSLFPRDPELLFRAGIIHRELGDLTSAERCYVTLLTARETGHIDSLDVSMTTFKAHHNLALIYQDMGRFGEAEREWRAALADDRRFVPSWLGLAELMLRLGRVEEAKGIAVELRGMDPARADELARRTAGTRGK